MYDPGDVVRAAEAQLGVSESPRGSNDGVSVRKFQAVTGAYRAAWCASFAQYCLVQAGAGPIANRSAGVYYIVDYARKHGWIVSRPRPGDLVCFIRGSGHMGIVRRVTRDGFSTVEGNAANSVLARSYNGFGAPNVFIRVPGWHVKKKTFIWVPRFQIVSSEHGKAKVVVPWGPWSIVGPKVPGFAGRWRAARVRRKLVKKAVWK